MRKKTDEPALWEKREYKVTEGNIVAQQQYTGRKSKGDAPSLAEEKALAYVLSKIKPTETQLQPIIFETKEFCNLCGLVPKQYYTQVKEVLDKLLIRRVWIPKEDGNGADGYTYFQHVGFTENSGKMIIEINPLLAPYFVQLTGNFYQFTFHSIVAMKSAYGVRLYKLLKSLYFKNRNVQFEIDTLKGHLDCIDKHREFKNFRRKVIEPALKDINTYSDLKVEVEYIKTGKTVTGVAFYTIDLLKEAMPEDLEEAKERHRNVDREVDPDQLVFDEIFDGIGDYPL